LTSDGLHHAGLKSINLRAKLEDIGPFVKRYAQEPENRAVFTLVDLYEMTRVDHPPTDCLEDKVARVLQWLNSQARGIPSDFYYPHIAVHDIEAWILAEGAALAKRLHAPSLQPDPEAERKDFANPPKRRLNEMFRKHLRRRYEENRDARALFSAVDPAVIHKTCHHYRLLYDDLSKVARSVCSPGVRQR